MHCSFCLSKYIQLVFDDSFTVGSLGETAKELWNKITFVASEDATVVDSTIEWGKHNDWKILYSDLFDRRQVISGYNITRYVG